MKHVFSFRRLRLLMLFGLLVSAATTHAQSWQWANTPGAGSGDSHTIQGPEGELTC